MRAREGGECFVRRLCIGVGVGSTFKDISGVLCENGSSTSNGQHSGRRLDAAFEEELLDMVNATGIYPGALGGKDACPRCPCRNCSLPIAALPLAINMRLLGHEACDGVMHCRTLLGVFARGEGK